MTRALLAACVLALASPACAGDNSHIYDDYMRDHPNFHGTTCTSATECHPTPPKAKPAPAPHVRVPGEWAI
jgi:hypothetical protein